MLISNKLRPLGVHTREQKPNKLMNITAYVSVMDAGVNKGKMRTHDTPVFLVSCWVFGTANSTKETRLPNSLWQVVKATNIFVTELCNSFAYRAQKFSMPTST